MKLQSVVIALAFVTCVAISLVNSRAGYVAFGIAQFGFGCFVVYRQEIGVGIQGRAPTIYVRGLLAILIGVGAMLLGLLLIFWPSILTR